MNMYKGTLAANDLGSFVDLTATKSTEENGTDGDFIAFDLFFQTNKETTLYLTNNSNVIAGDTDTNIQNATRVALVPQGNISDTSNSSVCTSFTCYRQYRISNLGTKCRSTLKWSCS